MQSFVLFFSFVFCPCWLFWSPSKAVTHILQPSFPFSASTSSLATLCCGHLCERLPLIVLDCGSASSIKVVISCSVWVSVHEQHKARFEKCFTSGSVCVHTAALWSPHSSVALGHKSPTAGTTLCVVLPQLPRVVPAAAGEEHTVS